VIQNETEKSFRKKIIIISVNPVHNAQVCYFNNVWLMFLVFSKKLFFSNNRWSPPAPNGSLYLKIVIQNETEKSFRKKIIIIIIIF